MSRLAEHLTARLDAMELDLAELRAELEALETTTDRRMEAMAASVRSRLLAMADTTGRRLTALEDAAPQQRRRVAEGSSTGRGGGRG